MLKGRVKGRAVALGVVALVTTAAMVLTPLAAGAQSRPAARAQAHRVAKASFTTQERSASARAAILALVNESETTATATTTTVSTKAPTVQTGTPVTFTAHVQPNKVGHPRVQAGGTLTFSITGGHSSTINCKGGDARAIKFGRASCKVAGGQLQAFDSPYSVTATYSGDANFATSTSTPITETVTTRKTHVVLSLDARPTSNAGTTVTATVVAGAGTPLLSGSVLFAVASTHRHLRKPGRCIGGNLQPLVGGVATCVLRAGWFVVPKPTKRSPHPKATWNMSANFDPSNVNFSTSHTNKGGSSTT